MHRLRTLPPYSAVAVLDRHANYLGMYGYCKYLRDTLRGVTDGTDIDIVPKPHRSWSSFVMYVPVILL